MLRSESGVSAIEFALIAPLLFVLTFGIIEFGLLLFDKAVLTNASREGARAAIIRNFAVNADNTTTYSPLSETEIEDVVTAYANNYLINLGVAGDNDLTSDDITITYLGSSGGNAPEIGGRVTVDVQYTYDFLVFPNLAELIGGSFDGTISLVGTTVMRME